MTERPTRPLKIGGLFFGYGGLDQAVSQVLDAELAWVSEFDKGANKIIEHRYPGVPNIGDITKVDWAAVEPVDIITGGSPCQDLSHAGRRAGMTDGTRSNLWVSMREAIAVIRPRLVVWENVRGAFSAAADSAVEPCPGCVGDGSGVHLRALGRVLGDLSDLGYDAQWHGLRAADVGAPHGRFRVFVAAVPSGLRRGAWWPAEPGEAEAGRPSADFAGCDDVSLMLPTPQARDWKGAGPADLKRHDPNLSAIAGPLPTPRATDGTKGGPNQRGSSGDLMLPSAVARLLPTPAVNDMGEGKAVEAWDEWTAKMKAAHGNGNGHGASLSIEAQRLLPTPTVEDRKASGSAGYTTGHDGTTLTDATVRQQDRWGQYADAIHRWEALTRPAPAPTETGPKGSPRLSARFSEWMMGLPDGWITDVPSITRNEALKACGNGVVPQQATYALRLMLQRATELTSAPAHVGAFSSLEDQ